MGTSVEAVEFIEETAQVSTLSSEKKEIEADRGRRLGSAGTLFEKLQERLRECY